MAHSLLLRLTEIAWSGCRSLKKGDASARVNSESLSNERHASNALPVPPPRAGSSVRDVLMAAAQYAPCRIVDVDDAPPSTEPTPPHVHDVHDVHSDVAIPVTPYQSQLRYRAVSPPLRSARPASPTPVVPFRAYGWQAPESNAADEAAAPAEAKHRDSYYPMEVPIEAPEGVRKSPLYAAANAGASSEGVESRRSSRSSMGWALVGLAAFAIVLALLMVADRARQAHYSVSLSRSGRALDSSHDGLPSALAELPSAKPVRPDANAVTAPAALPRDARGIDPADLPVSKGVDVSTLPLAPVPARIPPPHAHVAH